MGALALAIVNPLLHHRVVFPKSTSMNCADGAAVCHTSLEVTPKSNDFGRICGVLLGISSLSYDYPPQLL